MRIIQFTIPIAPMQKHESRSFAIKTASGKFSTRQFKHKDQSKYENQIMSALIDHAPDVPLEGTILLGVKVFVPMPKYMLNSWKRDVAESGIIRPASKPDLSNYIKNIEDCMTKSGFWQDDDQVVEYITGTGKYYSIKPRWEVTLMERKLPRTKKEYESGEYDAVWNGMLAI